MSEGNVSTTRLLRMALAAAALMISLVLYGAVQEEIMTKPLGGEGVMFTQSGYLVLNNRVIAVIVAVVMLLYQGESLVSVAPLYKYAGISASNTCATYLQYEALKYVSFPTQTLIKCGKMFPVMIIGTVLSSKKYNFRDYAIATVVTLGCTAFLLSGDISAPNENSDSFVGVLMMVGYLFIDGFTSTFQEHMFKGYKMSTYSQMLYVNLTSAVITLFFVVVKGDLLPALALSWQYPNFLMKSLLLSVCAVSGQIAILYTIKEFGALFFATVMTTRQVISIIVSCINNMHPLSSYQWMSAATVFGTLYYKETSKPPHAPKPAAPTEQKIEVVIDNPEKDTLPRQAGELKDLTPGGSDPVKTGSKDV